MWLLHQALWEAAYPEEPFHIPGLEPPCSDAAAAPTQQADADGGSAPSSGSAGSAAVGLGGGTGGSSGAATGGDSSKDLACSYDIVAAAVRQFDFYWSVSARPASTSRAGSFYQAVFLLPDWTHWLPHLAVSIHIPSSRVTTVLV